MSNSFSTFGLQVHSQHPRERQRVQLSSRQFNGVRFSDARTLRDSDRQEEFDSLMGTINLTRSEDYDCSRLNVWSYRKGADVRDGVNIKFGNMCNGFPFQIGDVHFINSECAYIAGAYANRDEECVRIQKLISAENNGQKCKRVYRRIPTFTDLMRKDFYDYNVMWMLYVLWQKASTSTEFATLLGRIPVDAHVLENSSLHHGEAATFWGAQNKELMVVRKAVESEVARNNVFRYKKDCKHAQMLAANAINDIGHFEGANVMGKIIKMCSLSVIYGQEPYIDYQLLGGKELYLCGKRLEFPVMSL